MAAILQLSQYCTFKMDSISTVITEPGQPVTSSRAKTLDVPPSHSLRWLAFRQVHEKSIWRRGIISPVKSGIFITVKSNEERGKETKLNHDIKTTESNRNIQISSRY